MSIRNFDDLLRLARQQAQPQRLLFVFTNAELPDGASSEEREAFSSGEGGALVPHMCVDKLPEEVSSFAALAQEASQHAAHWCIVFVAALSGQAGSAPSGEAAQQHLQRLVEMIRAGQIETMLPFDRQGDTVQLA